MTSNTSLSIQVSPSVPPISSVVPILASSAALSSEDICINVFAFLPLIDLAAATCVNRNWKDWSKDKDVWECRVSQDVRDNFIPFINQRLLNRQEAYRYTPLSHFVSDTIVKRMTDSIRLQKNPTLGTVYNPRIAMPTPYIQYGNYSFTICDLTNIEIQEEGSPTFTLLPVEEGKSLTHLAVDGDILFALRKDGRIVRWNYKTKKRLEDIHTDLETTRNSPKPRSYGQFYVKDGYIIMTSSAQSRDDPDRTRLEIIPYEEPKKSQIINRSPTDNYHLAFKKIILKDNQMIGLRTSTSRETSSIWIKNLSTHDQPKTYEFDNIIYNMSLNLNTLYVVDRKRRIHKINLNSGNLTERFNSLTYYREIESSAYQAPTTIVDGLAFNKDPFERVIVEDLQSRSFEILLEAQSQIHDVVAYKRNLLKKLIERVKSKRKPSSYLRLKKIFGSILKSNSVRFLRKFIIPIMLACIAIISLIRRLKFK